MQAVAERNMKNIYRDRHSWSVQFKRNGKRSKKNFWFPAHGGEAQALEAAMIFRDEMSAKMPLDGNTPQQPVRIENAQSVSRLGAVRQGLQELGNDASIEALQEYARVKFQMELTRNIVSKYRYEVLNPRRKKYIPTKTSHKYVVRKKNDNGWMFQVNSKTHGYTSKFFADSLLGGNKKALQAAIEYRDAFFANKKGNAPAPVKRRGCPAETSDKVQTWLPTDVVGKVDHLQKALGMDSRSDLVRFALFNLFCVSEDALTDMAEVVRLTKKLGKDTVHGLIGLVS